MCALPFFPSCLLLPTCLAPLFFHSHNIQYFIFLKMILAHWGGFASVFPEWFEANKEVYRMFINGLTLNICGIFCLDPQKRAFYAQRMVQFFSPPFVFVTFSPPLCSLDPAGAPSRRWAAGEPFARQPRAPDIPLAVRQHRRLQQQLDAPAQRDGTRRWAPCTLILPALCPSSSVHVSSLLSTRTDSINVWVVFLFLVLAC